MIQRAVTECTISAAHHLPNYSGKCKAVHGHSWKIVVEIEGEVNEETGMVLDFVKVKEVINKYDHTDLNNFLENPTAENLVELFLDELKKVYPEYESIRIKVYESEKSYTEGFIRRI